MWTFIIISGAVIGASSALLIDKADNRRFRASMESDDWAESICARATHAAFQRVYGVDYEADRAIALMVAGAIIGGCVGFLIAVGLK